VEDTIKTCIARSSS